MSNGLTQTMLRTVLFSDLRGSTALFETLGNAPATAVITRSNAAMAAVVTECGGTVVKTLGDGLLAMFEDSTAALSAADRMHLECDRATGTLSSSGRGLPVLHLKVQVALARGELVQMSGDVFGDAVNVAARLLDHAGDDETLATAPVVEDLSAIDRSRFRRLDVMQLRGRAEPVEVHLLETLSVGDTAVTMYGEFRTATEPEGIRLTWLDLNRVYAGTALPVVLGRSPQVTYCVDDTRVSRSHARIDWHGGTFQLTDLSFNGTFVRYMNSDKTVSLRRGTCTLHGSGTIALGVLPDDPTAPTVRFDVLRFAETQPMGALAW